MLAGLFLSLHGIGKQIRNAFWFGFIRFYFHEMSGERCMGWEYLRKMMETTYVGLWGKGCEALCYLLCKGPTFFSGNDIMRYEGSLFFRWPDFRFPIAYGELAFCRIFFCCP